MIACNNHPTVSGVVFQWIVFAPACRGGSGRFQCLQHFGLAGELLSGKRPFMAMVSAVFSVIMAAVCVRTAAVGEGGCWQGRCQNDRQEDIFYRLNISISFQESQVFQRP
jgi:hypothetical protein